MSEAVNEQIIVRCPKSERQLTEPPWCSVYKCGAWGTPLLEIFYLLCACPLCYHVLFCKIESVCFLFGNMTFNKLFVLSCPLLVCLAERKSFNLIDGVSEKSSYGAASAMFLRMRERLMGLYLKGQRMQNFENGTTNMIRNSTAATSRNWDLVARVSYEEEQDGRRENTGSSKEEQDGRSKDSKSTFTSEEEQDGRRENTGSSKEEQDGRSKDSKSTFTSEEEQDGRRENTGSSKEEQDGRSKDSKSTFTSEEEQDGRRENTGSSKEEQDGRSKDSKSTFTSEEEQDGRRENTGSSEEEQDGRSSQGSNSTFTSGEEQDGRSKDSGKGKNTSRGSERKANKMEKTSFSLFWLSGIIYETEKTYFHFE
ncbi:hypothetical protein Ancab_015530 [Ancistrocladus abbreviatus]